MIPSKLINKFDKGCFVMHPSLLPKYRGASPIQHAILNGDKLTGVSIIEASKKSFDKGNIIKQLDVEIKEEYRFKELSDVLSKIGGKEIVNFLYHYDELVKNKVEQINTNDHLAPLISEKSFVYLDFLKSTSDEILLLYKAFYGSQLDPFTKIILQGKERLVFFEDLGHANPAQLETIKIIENIAKSGSFYWDLKMDKNSIYIKSKTGWLVSTRIKLDKKTFQPAEQVILESFRNRRYINDKTALAINTQPK